MITSSPSFQFTGVATCIVGELQRVDHAQDLVEVAAGAGRVGDDQADLLVRVDDEHRAHRERVVRVRVDHVVEVGDLRSESARIGKLTVVSASPRCRRSSACGCRPGRPDSADDLHVALVELGLELGDVPSSVVHTGVKSLGCEKSTPQLSPRPFVEVDGSLGRLGREVGSLVSESQSHAHSLSSFASVCPVSSASWRAVLPARGEICRNIGKVDPAGRIFPTPTQHEATRR